jgi:hypothetical protein
MNLRRGVLRLWLVLSLCWIVGVGVFAWGYEPWSAGRSGAARPGFRLVPRPIEFRSNVPPPCGRMPGSINCRGV